MRTRGSALVTSVTLTLAALVVAAPSPAAAPAVTGRVTANEPLPGTVDLTFGSGMDSVVTPDGKLLLASTNAGLSRMTLTRDHIVRTGTNSRGTDGTVLPHPNGRLAYVVRTVPYRQRLQVFDLRSRTPRLLRTLDLPGLGKAYGAALTPDGRRLFLTSADSVQILRLGSPGRPTKGPRFDLRVGSPAITPDGTRLVGIHSSRDAQDTVRVWDISQRGTLPLVAEREVVLPDRTQSYGLHSVLISPDGASLYVTATMFPLGCEEGDCGVETEVVRLRFSDLEQIGRLPRSADGKETFPAEVSNNGRRLYATSRFTDDQDTPPGSVVWLDNGLLTRNQVVNFGELVDLTISPGGATRGLLYGTTVPKPGRLKVASVAPG